MQVYLDLMKKILEEGDIKDAARGLLPRTKELFSESLKFNLQDGFPLLTTKKVYTKGVIGELLWFLRGSTYVDELIKDNINIWNEDCYQFYVRKNKGENILSYADWVDAINDNFHFPNKENYYGGRIYGYHWRTWGDGFINKKNGEEIVVDQICNTVNSLIKTPNSRYSIVSSWNPTIIKTGDAALPSCHVLFQTNVRYGKYLDLFMFQRSCDFGIGVPFNIASYGILTHILCELTGLKPGILIWTGGSVHIYENYVDSCLEQLSRTPTNKPNLFINTEKISKFIELGIKSGYSPDLLDTIFNKLTFEDFEFKDYNPQPTIKMTLQTGLKLDDYELKW